ncbi:MAG: DUF4156 domain-containing protein [Leptonema illini]|uniref:DUF4156 domain-containing protein n=1 Tax=Leptonema illini TaxID=183 RepID=A0A833LWP6_9LEPT|nr:MAG: DUF4156 domain-containing protein [Leptonema illini]
MRKPLTFFCIVSLTAILSCTSPTLLTPGGNSVQLLMKEEAPAGKALINDIVCERVKDIISAKNCLRNKTAELGGNLVVVDTIEVVYPNPSNPRMKLYTANGRAYK